MKNKGYSKLYIYISKTVSYLPSNNLRIWCYRNFFNFKIGKNVIIKRSLLLAKKVKIQSNVTILSGNVIICNSLSIGNGSSILESNRIVGPCNFTMGKKSRVIRNHYIDLSKNVQLGNNTWLAGKNSEIWTHGSLHTKTKSKNLEVNLGSNNYIGSSCLIAPGVKLGDINLIGLGSVLTKDFLESHQVILGNPARVIKKDIDWRINW